MKSVQRTDLGKVRKHNEDAIGIFRNENGTPLFVVADGMGGHLAGDVASKMVIDHFKEQFLLHNESLTIEGTENWLREQILKVNKEIFIYSTMHEECAGMGTTIIAAILKDDVLTIAHIGDSRVYVLGEESLTIVTEDHSLVNELVKCGEISREDAQVHPRRNVLLRALGTEPSVEVDVQSFQTDEKRMVLMCTDGLSNKVKFEEIEEVLSADLSIEDKADRLIQRANEAGGEDNISVILIDLQQEQDGGDE